MRTENFVTDLSLDQIEQRLSGFENFDLKEKTSEELSINVGNGFKYRFLGGVHEPLLPGPDCHRRHR